MPKKPPQGFTLVEMLVATALVVLIMLMFAQVFKTSSGLVSNQKGMAEHDQHVRTLSILLRGDVSQRTFRDVIPFYPGQITNGPDYEPQSRSGFFSISENDPNDGTDDVLHLTIKVNEGEARRGSPQLPFSGRAALIRHADPGATTPIPPDPPDANIDTLAEGETYLYGDATNPPNNDQPEFDDGQLSLNGTGTSRYMEVCWFLRNGVLYRRGLLIRDGYVAPATGDNQPRNALTARFIPGDYTAANVPPAGSWHHGSGEFWRDFDYSAYYEPPTATEPGGLVFHDAFSSLKNESDPAASNSHLLFLPASLGIPFLRFGSSTSRATADATTGIVDVIQGPRENLTAGDTNNTTDKETYIGRFTLPETSHSDFDYPGNTGGGDPFNDSTALTLTNSEVTEFGSTTEKFRRGEDIVMTNVHSFDIQVWDSSLRAFVNLGHGGTSGVYGTTFNADFGNRYDTWHPHPNMPEPPYPNPYPLIGGVGGPLPLPGDPTEVRLEAIRVYVRFFDVNSDSMRDLTFTLPLNP